MEEEEAHPSSLHSPLPNRVSGYCSPLAELFLLTHYSGHVHKGHLHRKHYNDPTLWLHCDKKTHTYTCCTCAAFWRLHEKIPTPKEIDFLPLVLLLYSFDK